MGVVCGYDYECVPVLLRELKRNLNSLVELNGLAELSAGSVLVGLLVDAGALDLEEEALLIGAEEINGFLCHCGKLRLVGGVLRVGLALYCGLLEVAVQRGLGAGEDSRHVAVIEEAEQRFLLICAAYLLKLGGRGDDAVSLSLCLLEESLSGVLAADSLLIEGLHAAAEGDIRTGPDKLLGD